MARVGVFVCHCGVNIAATVDVKRVVDAVIELPEVKHAQEYRFMCSSPGQDLIKKAIRDHTLDRIVVAACSPRMHLPTFQNTLLAGGLNPYLVTMANIREQCSWVTTDIDKATEKTIDLVQRQIKRVVHHDPLQDITVPITKTALVVGGGIAGIQAALDIADGVQKVILIERSPSIGGRMAQLDETFPTLDCSQCILTPKMVEAAQHPNIDIRVNTEVTQVEGYVGNFQVSVERKAIYVDPDKCIGCGMCQDKCPSKVAPDDFNGRISTRAAIYMPFPQAVPAIPVIDADHCLKFTKGKCGVCEKVCPADAIDFNDSPQQEMLDVGAIVVATGYQEMDPAIYTEYGGRKYPDVITGLQFERLISSTGPSGGKIERLSDGRVPKRIVFVQCVGSRDEAKGHTYCSGICCMYTAKHAMIYKHHVPEGKAYVCYIDVRAPGKSYEEFIRRAIEADDVRYMRGRVAKIKKKDDHYRVFTEDTLVGRPVAIDADMVVLASAVEPNTDAQMLARVLGISFDVDGFYSEAHPKLKPVETATAGIFLAGACQGPKDIPTSVQQGSAAASKVLSLFARQVLYKSPQTAEIDEVLCSGCLLCLNTCHYSAIEQADSQGRTTARVISGKCQGCGACVSVCKGKAIALPGYTDDQLYEEMVACS
jgi:heterodisulfide reductase subunit A